MTKYEIVIKIAEQSGVEQGQVREIVQLTLNSIIDVLASEGRLELRDFGVFEVVSTPERAARNPKTGAVVLVPARKKVKFNSGKHVAARMNKNGQSHLMPA